MKRVLAAVLAVAVSAACSSADNSSTVDMPSTEPAADATVTTGPTTTPVTTETSPGAETVANSSPASPPSAVSARRENPLPLGTAADVGAGWTLTVNSVELDAADSVEAANEFYEPPPEGFQYVVVDITATYNGDEPSDGAGLSIGAVGAGTNRVWNTGDIKGFVVAPSPAYSSFVEVFQGGEVAGNVLLQVPVEDIETLVIIGQAYMSFDDADRQFYSSGAARSGETTPVDPETLADLADESSREDPLPLGTAARVGAGWALTVNSVELDATDSVMEENQFNEPAPEGFQYVVVNITATYIGDEPSDGTGVSIGAVGEGTNRVSDTNTTAGFVAPPSPAYSSFVEVFQGGEVSGNVILEVPVEDIDTLVIIGQAFMSIDDADRQFYSSR